MSRIELGSLWLLTDGHDVMIIMPTEYIGHGDMQGTNAIVYHVKGNAWGRARSRFILNEAWSKWIMWHEEGLDTHAYRIDTLT